MIEDFEEKTPYAKKPLSIKTQVARLEKRGLIIDDENLAGDYLLGCPVRCSEKQMLKSPIKLQN